MKTLYFLRHGQTDYNKLRIVQGSGIDSALNEKGRSQARSFYQYYRDKQFDYVICSSLRRSYETIEPFIKERYLPFEKTSLINEISWGVHEGKKGTQEMKDNYERMVREWSIGNLDVSLEGAESARQLVNRLQRFLDYVTNLPHSEILICTHGRSLRCLLCLMKKQHLKEMENYDHFNTGLFVANFRNGVFDMILENDIRHLDRARENW